MDDGVVIISGRECGAADPAAATAATAAATAAAAAACNSRGLWSVEKKRRKSGGVRDEKQVEEEALKAGKKLMDASDGDGGGGGAASAAAHLPAAAAAAAAAPSVPYYRLFSHADVLDYGLMLVGSGAAAAHGISMPVFLVYLGKLIDSLGSMNAAAAAGAPNQVLKVSPAHRSYVLT
jgi:hypothetical protein